MDEPVGNPGHMPDEPAHGVGVGVGPGVQGICIYLGHRRGHHLPVAPQRLDDRRILRHAQSVSPGA